MTNRRLANLVSQRLNLALAELQRLHGLGAIDDDEYEYEVVVLKTLKRTVHGIIRACPSEIVQYYVDTNHLEELQP